MTIRHHHHPLAGGVLRAVVGLAVAVLPVATWAQTDALSASQQAFDTTLDGSDSRTAEQRAQARRDSLSKAGHKEIPRGITAWTIDERFGDRTPAAIDTLSHMYQNAMFTEGRRGEYVTTGNFGGARTPRIFADRRDLPQFLFTEPYDYAVRPAASHLFTNTLSPFTNVTLNTAGNRTNGEDDFHALFAVNAGKRLGGGFSFDYLYGRGRYQNQAASHFGYTFWLSYLGDRYQAHLLFSTNHQKMTESGGLQDDRYVTHPEIFNESFTPDEMPSVLSSHWNRHDNQHLLYTHRYNVGFSRRVPMTEEEIKARKFAIASKKENAARQSADDARRRARRDGIDLGDATDADLQEKSYGGRPDGARIAGSEAALLAAAAAGGAADSTRIAVGSAAEADSLAAALPPPQAKEEASEWMKSEYVPVTSFIHTAKLDNYRRIYQAYAAPSSYYASDYFNLESDSIYDRTRHYELRNTFAIALLEGFNKYVPAGLKAFVAHDLRHFELPDSLSGRSSWNEHSVYAGGQIIRSQGRGLRAQATLEVGVAGEDMGTMRLDGDIHTQFPLLGDTVRFDVSGYFHRDTPSFYLRHYQGRHAWWDNDMQKQVHTHLEGRLTIAHTGTRLRVATDQLKDYAYMATGYTVDDALLRHGVYAATRQHSGSIGVLTAELAQNIRLGALRWESVVTWQKSTNQDVLPVPAINVYTNLFLRFKIARVLKTDLGADARYFTRYEAPEWQPLVGAWTVQENAGVRTKVGSYPIVNVYANFHLQHTRFFVMYSHANSGTGNRGYFLSPHYPLGQRILRFGVSWNFFN